MADAMLQAELNAIVANGQWWQRQLLVTLYQHLPAPVRPKIAGIVEDVAACGYRLAFVNGHTIDIPAGELTSDATIARICLECP